MIKLWNQTMPHRCVEDAFEPYLTPYDCDAAKTAIVVCPGGAYCGRADYEGNDVGAWLNTIGITAFVLEYRVAPSKAPAQPSDAQRAMRLARKLCMERGIERLGIMGFSAGGIQAGEFLMHYDEDVNGTALDESYVPDALDAVPAHASAAGMIYSFYGRLSVGNMDPDWLAEGDLPPTFYVYGTEDPFYRQFQQQYDVIRNMGISTGRIVLNGWPHGFGSDGGWVNDYAAWLESVFANKEEF